MRSAVVLFLSVLVLLPAVAPAAPRCGDPDGSHTLTASDSLTILKGAVGQPVACPECACDVNADGKKSAGDALAVLKMAVGGTKYLACFTDAACEAPVPAIDTVAPLAADPFALLTVGGTSLDGGGDHFVRFITPDGVSLLVPAVGASSSSVVAAVPPLVASGGAQPPVGAVVQVLEEIGTSVVYSNALGGVDIGSLPVASGAPGSVTRDFLLGAIELGTALDADVVGTSLDTPELHAAIADSLAHLQTLMDGVDDVMNGVVDSLTLGTLDGSSVDVHASDLSAVDGSILGMLLAQSGSDGGASFVGLAPGGLALESAETAGCGSTDALAYYNDQLNGLSTTSSRPSYFGSGGGCTAQAFNTSFAVVGGSAAIGAGILILGGAPAIALSLPAAAMLYVTIAGSGGMIAVGGALGQASEDARALVKEGVAQIESALQSAVTKNVLPEAVGNLYEMADGAKKLYDALAASGSAPPTTTTSSSTSTTLGAGCWCCCAWWDGCCTNFTCRESATDVSGSIDGTCFYYDPSLCGTGFCENG